MKIFVPSSRQKKILEFFTKNNISSLSDIIRYIEREKFSVTRITIIRDLKKLVEQGYISKIGAGSTTKYSLKVVYSMLETIDIEKYFSADPHKRNAQKKFSFELLKKLEGKIFLPEEAKKLAALHQKFQQNFQKFNSPLSIQKEFERIIIEFAWKSSSIEGNTYSVLETERLIKELKTAEGKTQIEAKMILNHKTAFDFVLQHREYFQSFTRRKLEELHTLLTQEIGIIPNIRKTPVGISGSEYKPLDNQFQIAEALEKILLLLQKKENFFEISFLLLILLSYLQAFEDGNKRTARMSANAILLANNSCPLSYKTINEMDYKKATLLFYEQHNITAMKDIFINQYEEAVENYF